MKTKSRKIFFQHSHQHKDDYAYIQDDVEFSPFLFNVSYDLNKDRTKDLILLGEKNLDDGNLVSLISWQENTGSSCNELTEFYLAEELFKTIHLGNFDNKEQADFLLITKNSTLKPLLY